jgi:BirA family transcriptional regulator, biotin operon repressor / biotin---[acetyl-CoA-carboxylase] ligase
MHIIKLSATSSTNDYLKQLNSQQVVSNFTIVTTNRQENGKGQMGTFWESEEGKNLTFSILLKDLIVDVRQLYTLNILVSLAIVQVLEKYKIPKLTVKWPNDIMSGQFKLGGILIENNFKSNRDVVSIVGIGLNVNQLNFDFAPQAISLKKIMGVDFQLEELLLDICVSIQQNIATLKDNERTIWQRYHTYLHRKGVPTAFERTNGNRFMGIIQKVTPDGLLQVLMEDDSIEQFDVKEIKML